MKSGAKLKPNPQSDDRCVQHCNLISLIQEWFPGRHHPQTQTRCSGRIQLILKTHFWLNKCDVIKDLGILSL